ncbi:MAG: hypothetical protein NWR67_06225 [Saprospiraceae bacterium]|jgi:hypothetical protein|nr:hypothetical protein [Saprospiraceae bacterium]MDP4820580.1 hypothetical protein [Saprospiraceae bacterium]MDP5000157.1 hypothetical protein [Saprospiraceae bacterium]
MKPASDSIFQKALNPFVQAAITLGLSLFMLLSSKLVNLTGIVTVSDRFPWTTAATFILFFAIFNSVFSLTAADTRKYWGRSMYAFLGVVLVSGGLAYLFSSISLNDAGSYRWIFFVLSFGYLVFISIMVMARKIVEFAQREEWNQPRHRR